MVQKRKVMDERERSLNTVKMMKEVRIVKDKVVREEKF